MANNKKGDNQKAITFVKHLFHSRCYILSSLYMSSFCSQNNLEHYNLEISFSPFRYTEKGSMTYPWLLIWYVRSRIPVPGSLAIECMFLTYCAALTPVIYCLQSKFQAACFLVSGILGTAWPSYPLGEWWWHRSLCSTIALQPNRSLNIKRVQMQD